jgi:hypothetical protein
MLGKHRRDDNDTTALIAVEVPPPESGPMSLKSHDFQPMYKGGVDPHETAPLPKHKPLVAEPDPEVY